MLLTMNTLPKLAINTPREAMNTIITFTFYDPLQLPSFWSTSPSWQTSDVHSVPLSLGWVYWGQF